MKAHLTYLRDYITENLWVIPSLLTASAIALSFALVALDRSTWGQGLAEQGWVYPIDPEGARLTLSTLAGSMITVTSLVFSLTILALTVAAQQLGPRLLRNFVRDRVTQVVLGIFLSTFVFALLVLRAVNDADGDHFVPYCSLTVALILAITSFGALIFFMHHIANTIQADTVIANITDDLYSVLARTFPDTAATVLDDAAESGGASAGQAVRDKGDLVPATQSGYVQIIDYEGLLQLATKKDLCISLCVRSGHFLIPDSALSFVAPADAVTHDIVETIRNAVRIGTRRTPAQDPEFLFANLVEIAVRALSPGVNDHYTATACIDRLCEALAEVLNRPPLSVTIADDGGSVRLVREPPTFPHLLDSAFNEIRQSAPGNVAILSRLADRLVMLDGLAERAADRQAILSHGDWIEESARQFVSNQNDCGRVTGTLTALRSGSRGRNSRSERNPRRREGYIEESRSSAEALGNPDMGLTYGRPDVQR